MTAITNEEWLADYEEAERTLQVPKLAVIKTPVWNSIAPPAEDISPSSFIVSGIEPTSIYTYTAADGAPIGYVGRYDVNGNEKLIPWSYGRVEGASIDHWETKPFSGESPIYGLSKALEEGEKQLIIVSDELNADAGEELHSSQIFISWFGGDKKSRSINWTSLSVRSRKSAFLWPTNDDDGRESMRIAGESLFELGYDVKMIVHDAKRRSGWTLVDAVAEGVSIPSYILNHAENLLPSEPPDLVIPDEIPPQIPTISHFRSEVKILTSEVKILTKEVDEGGADRWRMADWQNAGMVISNGRPVPNISNIALVLDQLYSGLIWYDNFIEKIMTITSDGKWQREWIDADDVNLTIVMQRKIGIFRAERRTVSDAVKQHARKDMRNEVYKYIASLEHDGISRIEMFFIDACGTPDTPYFRAAGRNFFIGMVARAMMPGCKLDTMVVLEGPQGYFKSSLFEVLGGRWYCIMRESPISKDFEIAIRGKWLVEMAEMDAFGRAGITATKRTLSTNTDRYRQPYDTHAKDNPRKCIFGGTTNRDDWLSDETGARRFWPIPCQKIDIEIVRSNRDQLFAEARELFGLGEKWWEMPEEETKKEQGMRFDHDVWTGAVLNYAKTRSRFESADVLDHLGIEIRDQDQRSKNRVNAILRVNGYIIRPTWDGTTTKRIWFRKN